FSILGLVTIVHYPALVFRRSSDFDDVEKGPFLMTTELPPCIANGPLSVEKFCEAFQTLGSQLDAWGCETLVLECRRRGERGEQCNDGAKQGCPVVWALSLDCRRTVAHQRRRSCRIGRSRPRHPDCSCLHAERSHQQER